MESRKTNVIFACPVCESVYQATQVRCSERSQGQFICKKCGARVYAWFKDYKYVDWGALKPARANKPIRRRLKSREPQSKPRRIQRKREKGWKVPPNTIYVGKGSKWWQNQYTSLESFRFGKNGKREHLTAKDRVANYRKDLRRWMSSIGHLDISELRGKNLMCWCALDTPCHADVLLDIANETHVKEDQVGALSMILPKSEKRFSGKIMLKQKDKA